jgi:hypothetical protein
MAINFTLTDGQKTGFAEKNKKDIELPRKST